MKGMRMATVQIKKIAYAILDALTFYKGVNTSFNGVEMRLPIRWSRYFADGYEKEIFTFFKSNVKPKMLVLDIGSHIGIYAPLLSRLTGKEGHVYCFEPTPGTYKILEETVRINKCNNVTTVNAAVANKSGQVDLYLATKDGNGSNANTMVSLNVPMEKVTVKSYSIDDFRKEKNIKIDVMKIDVEGVELSVLKGARETFLLDRPIGVLALHPSSIIQFGDRLKDIWDCLKEYKLHIKYNGEDITEEFFCSQTLFFDVTFSPQVQ